MYKSPEVLLNRNPNGLPQICSSRMLGAVAFLGIHASDLPEMVWKTMLTSFLVPL